MSNKTKAELVKINKHLEDEGQKWFAQMHAYVLAKDYDSFNKHMKATENNYQIEYEILGCIGALTERAETTTTNPVNPAIVSEIKVTDPTLHAYKISTIMGDIGFFTLSKGLPFTADGIPNNQRQGECHEKSFEIASRIGNNARLVTGLVSILSEKHTFLHSWVEDDDSECVYDYTINAGIGIQNYRVLMHAQTPLIEISSKDIKTKKVEHDDWVRMIHALYGEGEVNE